MKKRNYLLGLALSLSFLLGAGCTPEEDNSGDALLLLLLATPPASVRFTNNSGSTVTYALHPSSSCTDTAMLTFTVANGATSEYQSVTTTHSFAINRNSSTCSSKLNLERGKQYTITDTGSDYTFSEPIQTGLTLEPQKLDY